MELIRTVPIVVADTFPSFSVHKNGTNQTGIVTATYTLVTWSTEAWDTNSNFASNRFTPTVAGKYLLIALSHYYEGVAGLYRGLIYKNGATEKFVMLPCSSGEDAFVLCVAEVDANGSTDYFEVYTYQNTGANRAIDGATIATYFQGHKLP